jgi:hypothetical protein
MAGSHGALLRGLMSTPASPQFQGRFGRIFRSLPHATFGASEAENIANLTKLGEAMSAGFDKPFDGKDPEESGIPALYTYFGQFIDHDLTFDPDSSLQKQNDPDALTDYRNPAFDLDCVYGRGPDDQPYMYDGGNSFLLGDGIQGAGDANARDLPRNNATVRRALIGDPRNDENAIVSQLQGLVLRFHNRIIKDNPGISFNDAQQLVRFHYQYVILHDFLPRIIHSSVLSHLRTSGQFDKEKLKFFTPKNEAFMPVEFSVAAYRLGHSMVRPGYRPNDHDQTLLPIFPVPPDFPEGLTGFRVMNPNWALDWGRFIDIDVRTYDGTDAENKRRLQFAYRLDTSLVNPLASLPESVVKKSDPPASLAARNLLRGWRLGLPSGQRVARKMGITPLSDEKIILGKAVEPPEEPVKGITSVSPVFKGNCPLWAYILAEAMQNREAVMLPVKENIPVNTPRLGPVGGRIVAEVFLGLMFMDKHSLLHQAPSWQPKSGPGYQLKDFVRYGLGM